MDDDNSGGLDLNEFTKAVKDYKVGIDENTLKIVFEAFDRDKQGSIDYDEFVRGVRGPMSTRRQRLVERAFQKLDKDRSGVIDINDIRGVYDGKNHPDVKAGKKTEDQVLNEFLETFEMHFNIGGGTKDHSITKEEFMEYYNNISCSIDDDRYFDLMITNAWKLGPEPQGGSLRHKHNPSGNEKVPYGVDEEPTNYATKSRMIKDEAEEEKAAPKRSSTLREEMKDEPKKGRKEQEEEAVPDVDPEEKRLFDLFRDCLKKRGTRGIFGIQRMFKVKLIVKNILIDC